MSYGNNMMRAYIGPLKWGDHLRRHGRVLRAQFFAATLIGILATAGFAQASERDATFPSGYSVSGATAYEPAELMTFAFDHVNATHGAVTVEEFARALELVYREDGYFLAEVAIALSPDGSRVDFIVDEGRIDVVSIEGFDAAMFGAIKAHIEPLVGVAPLTLPDFERAIMLVNDLAGVYATTEIDYPDPNAGARLRVIGAAEWLGEGSFTIDNPPRELGDAVSGFLTQEFYSTLVPGDLLRIQGAATWYFNDGDDNSLFGSGVYRAPLGASGAYGELFLGNVVSRRDASGQFQQTDFDGFNAGGAVGYPVLRNLNEYGYVLGEYRFSTSDSDVPDDNLDSSAHVISAAALYGRTEADGGAIEVGVNLAAGWQSDDDEFDDGDDAFWHLRAGVGYETPLDQISEHMDFRTEIWGQASTNRLPTVEKFYLGDRYWLRGYAFDEADGDTGLAALFELSKTFYVEQNPVHSATPFLFLDAGYVDNKSASDAQFDNETLVSTGLGLEIEFFENVSVLGTVGVPLTDGPLTDSGDPAGYLRLTKFW